MGAFQLQGHRGARGLFPENTVEGFRAGIAMGLRAFELDVGVLGDGTVVVHHDLALNPDLARGPGGGWSSVAPPLLRRMEWEELQDYDVGRIRPGSATAERFPDQVAADGARVPRLVDVLRLDARVRWNIELKLQPDRPEWTVPVAEMVERTLAAVDEAGAAGRVTVQSFDWRAPRHAKRVRPEVARGWLTRAETVADPVTWWGVEAVGSVPWSVPGAIAAEGGGTWTPYWEELTPALLAEAHGLGLLVVPWTVNEAADMRRLVEWGVDGLITDRPDRFEGAALLLP